VALLRRLRRAVEPVSRPLLVGVCATLLCCVGTGDLPVRVSGQIVGSEMQALDSGLVLVEYGKVHEGAYQTGALIDKEGRFSFELPHGGTWGVHLFHDSYSYIPLQVTLAEHEQKRLTSLDVAWGTWMDQTGLPSWPNQPDDVTLVRMPPDDNPKENPTIDNITMTYLPGDIIELSADVADPNNKLSRMILAYDASTGAGYALNPPSSPDAKGQYPPGTYTMKAYFDPRYHVPGRSTWYFVVSNLNCKNTKIKTITMPPR